MLATSDFEPIMAAVVRASLDCAILVDERSRVLEFNPASEHTFGYTREEALGRLIADLIVPGHLRDAHSKGFADYVAGAPPKLIGKRIETEGMRKDGSCFPVELTITELNAASGRMFTASLRDLTGKVSQKELDETRRQLEIAVEGAKLGTWTFNLDSGSVWYSDRSKEMLGLDDNVVPDALSLSAVIHPDDWPRVAQPYYDGFPEDHVETEFRVPRKDGSVRWILAVGAARRDEHGKAHTVNGINIDITDRKRSDEELEQARRHLELAVSGAKIGIWTVDPETGETWYSDRSRDLWGVGKELRIDAKTLKSYIHPDDWHHIIRPYHENFPGDVIAHEIRVIWPNGEQRWVQSLGRAIRDDEGEVILVTGIHLDITDRKRADEELHRSRDALHQSEKLAALGALLAGVSHELNNPLAAIVGQAEMLEEDCAGTDFAERARKISSAGSRCARIVQTFLAMARQHEPKREAVDINALISSALDVTEYGLRTGGISVRVTFGSPMPLIDADRDQLHQVLINLIINAQQAMEKGEAFEKMLSIRTSVDQSGHVLVDVVDTGPGVPADLRTRIFEPFFSTKGNKAGGGTGIGLSFSHGIIAAHAGQLSVEPRSRGAHFRINLPPSAATALAPVSEHQPGPAVVAAGRRVLVVEDEPDVADTLSELLERDGFEVTVATDGTQAFFALDKNDFDLLFSDLRMPLLNGQQLYERLCEIRPQLVEHMAFVTGDTVGDAMAEFVRSSGRPVLEKPFTKAGIRAVLAALVAPEPGA